MRIHSYFQESYTLQVLQGASDFVAIIVSESVILISDLLSNYLTFGWKRCLEAEVGFREWLWQYGGGVLCGKKGPHLLAVVLASSRDAAWAGTGESNLRYVLGQ